MSKRFFNPYIGKSYQTGILGKSILVIGASHYCDKTDCPYFNDCTNEHIKDSSRFDNICWEYQRNGLKQLLSDNTKDSIENEERAYCTFARALSKYVNVENDYDVWEYVAFANYVQFLLPHIDTYDYDVSDRDFEAFMETLQELKPIPDIIIVWGDKVNRYLKQDNPYIVDKKELDETEWYLCHMREPKSNKKIAIVNPYHPSSRKYWYNNIETFKLYLEKAFAEQ